MTRFGWTPIREVLKEPNIRDLVQAYFAELWGEARVPCVPDWEKRCQLEDQFLYRVWTAHVDDTMAGFIEWHITPTINAKDTLFALDAGHFIAPTFRGNSRLGYRMWSSCIRALEELGVKVVLVHDNIRHPLMPFFLSLGFKPIGTLYHKVLEC